jgi:phage tail sheath protein FI
VAATAARRDSPAPRRTSAASRGPDAVHVAFHGALHAELAQAPANEAVRGALGLASGIGAGEAIAINERHVNAIREFPGRGIVLWGARTLSSDPKWRYISGRLVCEIGVTAVRASEFVILRLDFLTADGDG